MFVREYACLEVQARGKSEVGVARARVAVDAAVLASLIGIDRLRERKVGRVVARDDRARPLQRHHRLGPGLDLGFRLAVASERLEAPRRAVRGAASLDIFL